MHIKETRHEDLQTEKKRHVPTQRANGQSRHTTRNACLFKRACTCHGAAMKCSPVTRGGQRRMTYRVHAPWQEEMLRNPVGGLDRRLSMRGRAWRAHGRPERELVGHIPGARHRRLRRSAAGAAGRQSSRRRLARPLPPPLPPLASMISLAARGGRRPLLADGADRGRRYRWLKETSVWQHERSWAV